jgi:Yip1-like protein
MALMERAKNILLQPKQEWPVIDTEQTSVGSLYTGYIMPLAAIGPIAQLIGSMLFRSRIPFTGITYRVSFSSGITSAIVTYVLGLVGVFVLALIIDALAPTFGGQKNQLQALKVAAYSSTAAWVGGIFGLIPALTILGLLAAIYGLYLLYLGLPVLMKAPQDKAVGYTVVVILVAIVLYFVIGIIVAQFAYRPAMGMP